MELSAAHSELSSAQSELSNANRELSAAQADLAHCEHSLSIAKSAMDFAQAAVSHAETSLATAAEAADAIAAADPPLTLLLNQQKIMYQDLQVLERTNESVHDDVSQAQENLRWADQHTQTAEETALLAGNDLSLRIEKLTEFDRIIQLPPEPS
jgi:chromosome segregation ATPase